jgi:hypothetical protein
LQYGETGDDHQGKSEAEVFDASRAAVPGVRARPQRVAKVPALPHLFPV